ASMKTAKSRPARIAATDRPFVPVQVIAPGARGAESSHQRVGGVTSAVQSVRNAACTVPLNPAAAIFTEHKAVRGTVREFSNRTIIVVKKGPSQVRNNRVSVAAAAEVIAATQFDATRARAVRE